MLLKSSIVRMTVSYPEIMATPVAFASAAKANVTAMLVLPFGLYHSLNQALVLSSIKMSSFCGESRVLCGNKLQLQLMGSIRTEIQYEVQHRLKDETLVTNLLPACLSQNQEEYIKII